MEKDKNLISVQGVPMPPKEFEAFLKAAPEISVKEAQAEIIKPCISSKEYE